MNTQTETQYEPDFSYEGVDENEALNIKDGEAVIDLIRQNVETGIFNDIEFEVYDDGGNSYFLECIGFLTLNRFGKERLYLSVMDLEAESNSRYTYYVAKRADGEYVLVHETDEDMFNAFEQKLESLRTAQDNYSNTGSKKKGGNGWKIAFKIILFPFWLIWQFIKALLSLFNIAVGDSSAVKAFKRGYNGDSEPMKEYTFINSMGCEQTVYSSNGREFYDANGAYVGKSNDNGKHIS
ncbi:MAG: hypothetical protein K2K80_07280 [Clostridia bacterium]|nr:hypothetical protein [Clostridia bacterium]